MGVRLLVLLLAALGSGPPSTTAPAASAPRALAAPAGAAQARQRTPNRQGKRPGKRNTQDAAEPRRAVAPAFRKLTSQMPDGVTMTADVYRVAGRNKKPRPVVVCLHGLDSSRAEYRRIAPELNALGYHALAIDLRSGGSGERLDPRTGARYGTANETMASAESVHGRKMEPRDARSDLPYALAWTRKLFPESPIALLGSTFSASLAMVFAAEHPDEVDAVLAFSPGEYFDDVSIAESVVTLSVPTYVTCGKSDEELAAARPIAEAVEQRVLTLWPPEEGLAGDQGARALLIPDPRSRARQWTMVERVMGHLRRGEFGD